MHSDLLEVVIELVEKCLPDNARKHELLAKLEALKPPDTSEKPAAKK